MPIPPRQFTLPLPHRPATGREDFLVTPGNQEAVAWIDRWPEWPGGALVLHGPAGYGKSHLVKVWQARAQAVMAAAQDLLAVDLADPPRHLAVEDVDLISGDGAREQVLFHLINLGREQSGTLLLTSAKAPALLGVALPDLRSRLLAVHSVALQPPDDQLLAGMLLKQFNDRQLLVGHDVLDYLLTRAERNPGGIAVLVAALDEAALAEGRAVTVPLARRVLERLAASG